MDERLYFEQFRGDDPGDDIVWIGNFDYIVVFRNGDIGCDDVEKWGFNRFTIEPSDGSDEWKRYGDGFNTRNAALDAAFVDSGYWQDRPEEWEHWFGTNY